MQERNVPNPSHIELSDLPGPDTTTKREAHASDDLRVQCLLAESARVGWPAAYQDDLYRHDLMTLLSHPKETFVWILREHGTHLLPVNCQSDGEAHHSREVARYWSGEHQLNMAEADHDRARYYLLSAKQLRPLDWQQAVAQFQVASKPS